MSSLIGEQISERRKELGITQASLAELAHISVNSLSRIESGKANPTLEILQKIAEILGFELKLVVKGNL